MLQHTAMHCLTIVCGLHCHYLSLFVRELNGDLPFIPLTCTMYMGLVQVGFNSFLFVWGVRLEMGIAWGGLGWGWGSDGSCSGCNLH